MVFLIRKNDEINENQTTLMDEMDCHFPASTADDLLSDVWPSNPDDFLDNIFSLDNDSLNLLDGYGDPANNVAPTAFDLPASTGSDSGLSSDQIDNGFFDQQLSPFPRDLHSSPQSSPHSGLSSGESSAGSCAGSVGFPSSPETGIGLDIEDQIELFHLDQIAADRRPNTQTFQGSKNSRKRRQSSSPNATIVTPKIQRHYVSKSSINIGPANNITNKSKIVVSNAQKHVKVSNIQMVNQQPAVTIKSLDGIQQNKVIRVAPMPGNPRSILLPVTIKDMKDFRSIKIINAKDLGNSANIKIAATNLLNQTKQNYVKTEDLHMNLDFNSDSNDVTIDESHSDRSDDEDSQTCGDRPKYPHDKQNYPRLVLTAEERKLLSKEGIKLPGTYPLTKQEERELKRIRRKIRNKISAQDSRKRKKEYVDGLEDRVRQCTEDNQTLMKKIKFLQSQNHSLAAQVRRLQSLLSRGNGGAGGTAGAGGKSGTQPATCLLVLLLSMALVALPNVKPGMESPTRESQQADAGALSTVRRALLSAASDAHTHAHNKPEEVIADEEFSMEEFITFKEPHSDHDYQLVRSGTHPATLPTKLPISSGTLARGYLDVPIDEDWPPNPARRKPLEFDLDDGQDNLPTIIKEENFQSFDTMDVKFAYDNEFLKLDKILPMINPILHVAGKISDMLDVNSFISVKTEDIITEEVDHQHDIKNNTQTCHFVTVNSEVV